MPALANREKYEQTLAADLAILLHQFAIATPYANHLDGNAAAGLTRITLIPQLETIYRAAAEQAARDTQTTLDRRALMVAARQWAVQAADALAQRMVGGVQKRLQEAKEESLRQGTSIAILLLPMLSDLLGRSEHAATAEQKRPAL